MLLDVAIEVSRVRVDFFFIFIFSMYEYKE